MTVRDWTIALGAGGIFLLLSLWNITLPGLQYDECLAAAPAVNFLAREPKTEAMSISPSVIHIAGHPIPLMIMTYIGPVKTILHIPIFSVFGISPTTVRLLPVVIVFLCFPLLYYFCLSLFDQTIASFAVFLMAVDPSTVFYLTRDVGPSAIQVFLKLLSLVLFVLWWKHQHVRFLYAGAFVWGVGISHKVDFLWIVGGIVIAALAVQPKELLEKFDWKKLSYALFSLMAGALPIVAFNIATGGLTFAPLVERLFGEPAAAGFSFLSALVERLRQLAEILNGNFIAELFAEKEIYTGIYRYVLTIVFLTSFLWLLISVISKRKPYSYVGMTALWVFITVVLIASCFSPTSLGGHHLLALNPALTTMFAVFAISVTHQSNVLQRLRFDKMFIPFVLLFLTYGSVSIHRLLLQTGGTGYWSDAIYELSDYLEKKAMPVAAMDWGFTNNLIVLSKGALRMDRVYAETWKNTDLPTTLERRLNDTTLYLFHTQEFSVFPSLHKIFADAAIARGYRIRLDKEFTQRDGRVVYLIYTLEHP